MQLVKTETHEAYLPHKGSVSQFSDRYSVEYDTFDAKKKAHDLGWRKKAPRRKVIVNGKVKYV